MANGLVVADTAISVGGRAVLGASLGRVQGFQFTESSDLTLTVFGSVGDADRIGDASQTIVIPTEGFFMLGFTGRLLADGSSSAAEENLMLGLRVGSTNYWPTYNDNGVLAYYGMMFMALVGNSQYGEITGWGAETTASNDPAPGQVYLGIQESGIPTGSQSVGFVAGITTAGAILKGGTTASRAYLTVTDCT